MSRVLIAGYFGYGNLGDEAILSGMLVGLRAQDASLSFSVVGGDIERLQALHAVEAILWEDIEGMVAGIRRADLVLLGGGGLFHDYWPAQSGRMLSAGDEGLARFAGVPLLAALLNKPCMIYAAGVGPFQGNQGLALTRTAFDLADAWTVRDSGSLGWLEKAGITLPATLASEAVSADPAVVLERAGLSSSSPVMHRHGLPPGIEFMAVVLRPWAFGPQQLQWERQVAKALDRLLASTGLSVVFMPMQARAGDPYADDLAVARRVRDSMKHGGRAFLCGPVAEVREAKSLLAASRVVLAMRMHGALLAAIEGVPVVALAYDPKVEALMARLGLHGFCLTPDRWQSDAAADLIGRALHVGQTAETAAHLPQLRRLADRDCRLAVQLMRRGKPALSRAESVLRRESLRAVQSEDTWRRKASRFLEVESQRDFFMAERDRLTRQAISLQESLGGRLVQGYWAAANRLLPAGSRRKEAYRLIMGRFRRGLGPTPGKRLMDSGYGAEDRSSVDYRIKLARFADEQATQSLKPTWVVVATTPFRRSEGQRAVHMAQELRRTGCPVIYSWWRWGVDESELHDADLQGILLLPFDLLTERDDDIIAALPGGEHRILIEFPAPGLFGLVAKAHSAGWITIYDVVDDWEAFHSVGQAPWYDRDFERHLLRTADLVTAASAPLIHKVMLQGRREVAHLPNAASASIRSMAGLPPAESKVTIGYFGYLSPAWFDWPLVSRLARRHPEWQIQLIGYGAPDQIQRLPANISLIGERPQEQLGAIAASWNAALVPFKPGPVAHAADPIKTYEYLALGLPVVLSGGMNPPLGAEGLVYQARSEEEFDQAVCRAIASAPEMRQERQKFAEGNTWRHRADELQGLIRRRAQRIAEKQSLFGLMVEWK
jgi:polysaccharide pyruvyl transferase CsaB